MPTERSRGACLEQQRPRRAACPGRTAERDSLAMRSAPAAGSAAVISQTTEPSAPRTSQICASDMCHSEAIGAEPSEIIGRAWSYKCKALLIVSSL